MITFRHKGTPVSLAPGQLWSPPATSADTYRDAPATELTEIVRAIEAGRPWREVVGARYAKTNPWLHAIVTSPRRDLFFRDHPPKPGAKILDIGSGWGQIALPLARDPNARVVALEPTPERLAFIRAVARQEGTIDHLAFLQADFLDCEFISVGPQLDCVPSPVGPSLASVPPSSSAVAHEVRPYQNPSPSAFAGAAPEVHPPQISGLRPLASSLSPGFDLVTCIGVLEWVPKFRPGSPRDLQIDFLRRARAALSPGGQLVIGIENRLGLKYLLGARDDHIGAPNVAVYDAVLATEKWRTQTGQELRSFTFTRAELTELLHAAGFEHLAFFSAFPDYKLPEKTLPLGGPTNDFLLRDYVPEHDGCDGSILPFENELRSHYRSLAQLGIASDFAPSFFVTAS